jgi:hypothetical protein
VGLKITFSEHHFKNCISVESTLPWDHVQSIEVVGEDWQPSAHKQMKRYLIECSKEIKHQMRRDLNLEKSASGQSFRHLREVKKGIEKTLHRLRVIKPQDKKTAKPYWQEVQARQEHLMLQRWPLILEREEDYRRFHLWVKPCAIALLEASIDPVILPKGKIVQRKQLKADQKGVWNKGVSQLAAKLRSLEAQLDIYHPHSLPVQGATQWKQELANYLQASLEAMRCACQGCTQTMDGVCTATGQLYCLNHHPSKDFHLWQWARPLAQALMKMYPGQDRFQE